MNRLAIIIAAAFFGALPFGVAVAGATLDATYEQLAAGGQPKEIAAKVTDDDLSNAQGLNGLRLRLKSAGKEAAAQAFLSALSARKSTDAVLLNLSLSYVDQMMGKNLLRQGDLSTRSQKAVEKIIERDARHWPAWYIRGINNLYWPDWFGKAAPARDYLREAVELHAKLTPEQQDENDMYALGYLALGDAYALLDQPVEARRSWKSGVGYYPFYSPLRERLALTDENIHAAVRALRDANTPIDTDLAFIWSHRVPPYKVTLTGGNLYGPGPLDDQPLKPGRFAKFIFGRGHKRLHPARSITAARNRTYPAKYYKAS